MIDHISLPVSDYARSRAFYDKALGALGYKVAMEITDSPDYVAAGYGPAELPEPAFWIGAGARARTRRRSRPTASTSPSRRPAAPLSTRFTPRRWPPAAATTARPGLRPHYHANYYAAFVLDPDGHRLEAVCHLPEQQA